MKKASLLAFVLLFAFLLGCESPSATSPSATPENASVEQSLEKRRTSGGDSQNEDNQEGDNQDENGDDSHQTQFASHTFKYHKGKGLYLGGSFELPNGSKLSLGDGELTPPPGHPAGEDVTITMACDYDQIRNEVIFTFGPHGSTFSPGVRIFMDYTVLNIANPKLYYIQDDGTYELQVPENIDLLQKKVKLTLDHFSRYAIGCE